MFGPLSPGQYVIEVYPGPRPDVPAMMKVITVEEDVELELSTTRLPDSEARPIEDIEIASRR